MKNQNTLRPLVKAVKYALATSLSLSFCVVAQTPDTKTDDDKIEKIAVVGSRAAPRSIADSPVPIDIVGAEELTKSGSSAMLNMITTTIPSPSQS